MPPVPKPPGVHDHTADHKMMPLDGHQDTWQCTLCGHVAVIEAGFAVCLLGRLLGARVRILAPPGHPLHEATGKVTMTLSAALMWESRPIDMMAYPFAWPDGQLLVSLDTRPPVPHRDDDPGYLWPPVITVRPGDVELPSGEPVRCGHPVLDGDECDWCHQCPGCCACAAMRQGIYGTGKQTGG
jgi:hypothetical protein